MRNTKLKFGAILFIGIGLTSIRAQTMYVKEISGAQTAYTIGNLRKMTFSSGNVTVQETGNSSALYTLNGLKYLGFNDYTTVIEDQARQGITSLHAYPNPVTDVLNIVVEGPGNTVGSIGILSLQGQVLQEMGAKATGTITLNLGHLPQGVYLCRYCNASEIKTVKIIKQ